jgi:hypothetical protein
LRGEASVFARNAAQILSIARDSSRTEPGALPPLFITLAVVRRSLSLCARLWRDESDRPWLDTSPVIQMKRHLNKREPYPLSIEAGKSIMRSRM